MSINWRERFLQTKTANSSVHSEVRTILQHASTKVSAWLDEQKNNVGEDGAETAYYRFTASKFYNYPVYAKYNFAIVDVEGRKRYLTPLECSDLGFDFVKGTSQHIPFSKNTNDNFYQTYLRAQEHWENIARKDLEKARHQADDLRKKHADKPWRWPLYQQYLNSKEWAQKKKEVLFRDDYCCQLCGEFENLQVHHLTYNRVGNEALFDLVTLCSHCHANEHGKEDEE